MSVVDPVVVTLVEQYFAVVVVEIPDVVTVVDFYVVVVAVEIHVAVVVAEAHHETEPPTVDCDGMAARSNCDL